MQIVLFVSLLNFDKQLSEQLKFCFNNKSSVSQYSNRIVYQQLKLKSYL